MVHPHLQQFRFAPDDVPVCSLKGARLKLGKAQTVLLVYCAL